MNPTIMPFLRPRKKRMPFKACSRYKTVTIKCELSEPENSLYHIDSKNLY